MPHPDDWIASWEQGRSPFHRDAVHPNLVEHAPWLLARASGGVLVPLCGKSLDLAWLADRVEPVVGIEVSDVAIAALLEDREVLVADTPTHRVHTSGRMAVWRGDFFAIETEHRFGAVWDRAALVAIDPPLQRAYTDRLQALTPGGRILLSVVDYDPNVMSGPPFAVPPDRVEALFGADRVTCVEDIDVIDTAPRWRERGHTWFRSRLYRIG